MITLIRVLWTAPCGNRLRAIGWFLGYRYAKRRTELLLEIVWQKRLIRIPICDIQTLVAGLKLFTEANPWVRWTPLRDPERVIDLGANIGLASLYFALRFPQAKIAAVEMMPDNAAIVERMAALNGLNIQVVNIAIGASDGTAPVLINRSHTQHSLEMVQTDTEARARWGFTDKTILVPIARLGSLIRQLGWQDVDLLKVDIEGAEALLLDDIAGWSPMVRSVFLEIHGNVIERDAERVMASHGYRKFGQDRVERTELWFAKESSPPSPTLESTRECRPPPR